MSVDWTELDDATKKKLGLPTTTRKRTFTMDDVRSNAIRVLAPIAGLTQSQRRRVLEHALKVNAR